MVLVEIKKAVREERKCFEKILSYLEIIEVEKLFFPEYNSMFDYCRKELGYTDSEAQRRIDAMRTLKRHPIIKENLSTGEISLSQLSILSRLELEASREKMPFPDMEQLLPELLNKSVKETEEITRTAAKLPPKRHKIIIDVNEEVFKKWKDYRNQNYTKSGEALLEKFLDSELKSQDFPKLRKTTQKNRTASPNLRKTVLQKAKNQCQAIGCTNKMNLHIDHIVPVSRNGATQLENLRVLCHAHNQARNLGYFV